MSAGVAVVAELQALERRLQELAARSDDPRELQEQVAGLLESQTKYRISDQKESPAGHAWDEWSTDYAATRHSNQSLLISSQSLLDSIAGVLDGDAVVVGSNMVYAAAQNYGFEDTPQREYLGISSENEREILKVAEAWLQP